MPEIALLNIQKFEIEPVEFEINRLREQNSAQQFYIDTLTSGNKTLYDSFNSLRKALRELLSEENRKKVDLIHPLVVPVGEGNIHLVEEMPSSITGEDYPRSVKALEAIIEVERQKRNDDQLIDTKIKELEKALEEKTKQNKVLQANITTKQQSINCLTSENRRQMDRIHSLSIVSTCKKKIENEFKSMKFQLKDATEQNKLLKQKMENQRAELKNLNTKSTQISTLNAEIAKLKLQLEEKKRAIRDGDNELYTCNKKINDLEQQIMRYDEIINDLDDQREIKLSVAEDSNRECTICCEMFTEDRKKVAYGPCGHNIACIECSEEMLRKTMATAARGQKKVCPICRAEIKTTIILEGIY